VKIFVNQFADKVEKMQKCCNHLKLNIRKAGDNQQTAIASKTKPVQNQL
jgi:hypothetical protein